MTASTHEIGYRHQSVPCAHPRVHCRAFSADGGPEVAEGETMRAHGVTEPITSNTVTRYGEQRNTTTQHTVTHLTSHTSPTRGSRIVLARSMDGRRGGWRKGL